MNKGSLKFFLRKYEKLIKPNIIRIKLWNFECAIKILEIYEYIIKKNIPNIPTYPKFEKFLWFLSKLIKKYPYPNIDNKIII